MPYRLLVNAATRATGRLGWARGAVGALLGLIAATALARLLLGPGASSWLLAPIGASAVLVFVLPASPLAQPWPVIGGDLLSALVGLAIAWLVPYPPLAAALAIAAAIGTMSLARCLHPPGGACALLGALGAGPVTLHSATALLLPMALNLAALLAFAWFYNNATGHSWPHRMPVVPPRPPVGWLGSYDIADLDAVLEEWDEVLDVSREDLDALFRAVERRVQRRWSNSRD
ncbi:MAG TPA: HPP family protein [Novosphingobium sp.]